MITKCQRVQTKHHILILGYFHGNSYCENIIEGKDGQRYRVISQQHVDVFLKRP